MDSQTTQHIDYPLNNEVQRVVQASPLSTCVLHTLPIRLLLKPFQCFPSFLTGSHSMTQAGLYLIAIPMLQSPVLRL